MDTTSRTTSRFTATALAVTATFVLLGPPGPEPEEAPVVVHGGDTAQQETVDWALGRFRSTGLPPLPSFEVHLYTSHADCGGNLGYYRAGRIDLCTRDSSEPYARKFALHEMAHAWTVAHVDANTRARFMRLRGTAGWNDRGLPWKERGFEQAAEIIAWGIGEGAIQPLLPEPASDRELVEAFVLLTAHRPFNGAVAEPPPSGQGSP
ncbi:MAG: hypothetical protein ACRDHU_11765 [Actinomycetota bacterium]